jgi:hypothetical protein
VYFATILIISVTVYGLLMQKLNERSDSIKSVSASHGFILHTLLHKGSIVQYSHNCGLPIKIVRLSIMRLEETYGKIRIGKQTFV